MSQLDITELRAIDPKIVAIGSHPGIIQSILDFDYLVGREQPSVIAIIAAGRKNERYFFGKDEVLIKVYGSALKLPEQVRNSTNLFINLVSGRRVLSSTKEIIETLPNVVGGNIFAERLPEKHALELYNFAKSKNVWIAGGSSVGLFVGGHLKLGAIGGTQPDQLIDSNLLAEGQVAVVSSSGGMVNEIIRQAANSGYGLSFGLAIGGERFPILTPKDVFLAAQNDPNTKAIAYFGELGGEDEYELAELIKSGQLTKPVVAYIAGTVAELFETPPQFGHAKAMASKDKETASAKRKALNEAGATAANTFEEFIKGIYGLNLDKIKAMDKSLDDLTSRKKSLISSSVSFDEGGDVKLLGDDMV